MQWNPFTFIPSAVGRHLEQASEAGWDTADVRDDLAALFASQREWIGEIFAALTSNQG